MPYLSSKNYKRLQDDANNGRKAQKVFEHKAKSIAVLIGGGLRKYQLEKPEGVTDKQHNEYLDQLGLLASSLESMPLGGD